MQKWLMALISGNQIRQISTKFAEKIQYCRIINFGVSFSKKKYMSYAKLKGDIFYTVIC